MTFRITVADLAAVWVDRCPVTKWVWFLGRRGGRPHPASPTLDRIRPDEGYTPDNVAWLSWHANTAKGAASLDDLQAIVRWLKRVSRSA